MSKMIVKLSGCRFDGRSVDGEYDGGDTIASARKEAKSFAERCPRGQISICEAARDGRLRLREVYQENWLAR